MTFGHCVFGDFFSGKLFSGIEFSGEFFRANIGKPLEVITGVQTGRRILPKIDLSS